LDDCPRSSSQHVGLLYDERRAKLGKSGTLGALNPHGEPCKNQLRPGLAGHFRFPGGLDLTIVATHLKSGREPRSFELRRRSFEAFAEAAAAARALGDGDGDALILGDMNTMGCGRCSPAVSAEAELDAVDRTLERAVPALRRLPAGPRCSHHYSGKATLLDWAAAADLRELSSTSGAVVSGYCAALDCSGREPPRALERLSDHCPIYVDVSDVDQDAQPE
jgi:predicted extracellular nuclease